MFKGLLPITIVRDGVRGYVTAFAIMSALGFMTDAKAAGLPAAGCGSTGNLIVGSGAQLDGVGNMCIAAPTVIVSGSSSSAGTITLTPATGQFVHIVGITVDNCAGATAVTAAVPTTITSSAGLGLTLTVGTGATAGLCQPTSQLMLAPSALRATASGAQSVTLPTFKTNQTVAVNVYWFSAP